MSGFPILDLILGLTFIYFVMSIICSAVVESILTTQHMRAKVLTRWLMTIFNKEIIQPDGEVMKLGQSLADHCLTSALSKKGRSASFMDAKNFSTALFEKLSFDPNQPSAPVATNLDDLLHRIQNGKALDGGPMLSLELLRTIQFFGVEARLAAPENLTTGGTAATKNSLQIFREKIEAWFDSNMDRLSGEMKKKYVRPLTFWVALIGVVLLNVDTLQIATYLYAHQPEAAQFAARAEAMAPKLNAMAGDTTHAVPIQALVDSLNAAVPSAMPLGWTDAQRAEWKQTLGHHAIGWLATVMAVMMGAPFWFDLLNKIANLRGAGARPATAKDAIANPPGGK